MIKDRHVYYDECAFVLSIKPHHNHLEQAMNILNIMNLVVLDLFSKKHLT